VEGIKPTTVTVFTQISGVTVFAAMAFSPATWAAPLLIVRFFKTRHLLGVSRLLFFRALRLFSGDAHDP
jgi:hypothetical protein